MQNIVYNKIKLQITMKQAISILLVILSLSCATTKFTNNDRGNYGHKDYSKEINNVLNVKVGIIPQPETPVKAKEKEKRFFDLNDSLPHAYLRAITSKASNIGEITTALKLPIYEPPTPKTPNPPGDEDFTKIKVRLLISNIKKYYNDPELLHPNTRLEFLNTTFKLSSDAYIIESIDKVENDFETIDFGELSRDQTVKFDAKLTGEAGGDAGVSFENTTKGTNTFDKKGNKENNVYDADGNLLGKIGSSGNIIKTNEATGTSKANASAKATGKAEVAYANQETIKENLNIKFKKLKTGIAFTNKEIILSQRGSPLSDISDNVIINLTLKLDNKPNLNFKSKDIAIFNDLFDTAKKPIKPNALVFSNTRNVTYIPCSLNDQLKIDITSDGAIRKVKNQKKGRNILEWDDKVSYYTFKNNKEAQQILDISTKSQCNEVYRMVALIKDQKYILNIANPAQNKREVYFYGTQSCVNFKNWVEHHLINAKNATVSITEFQTTGLELSFFNGTTGIATPNIFLAAPSSIFTTTNRTDLGKIDFIGFEKVN
jgi:hypothetical protein